MKDASPANGNQGKSSDAPRTIRNMRSIKRTGSYICLVLVGTILITLGIFTIIYFEVLHNMFIQYIMTFDKNTVPFERWRTNDPPLDLHMYLFNWTNPEELRTSGVKPRFQEMGPYTFKEIKEKINITWHKNNNTVSYRHRKLYFFDEKNSRRQLNDTITTINAVPLTIAYRIRDFGYFTKKPISVSLSSLSHLYVTKTAGEILFDGYEERILSFLTMLPMSGVKDKFGMFYGKNNTAGDDGIFSMWTKTDQNYGKLLTWNYKNQSDFFEEKCGEIRGSAGEFYPINRKRDYIEVFSSELCKFAKLEYEKDVYVKGVLGYKYTGKNIFDNGTLRPENECFCRSNCAPSGVFNVSACREGSPTFLSMPHFYNADPYYINSIEGVVPQERHELFVTLEPKSGIIINAAARMQVNMLLQPVDYITMYEDVPKIFIPVFYFDQQIYVNDDVARFLIVFQNFPEIVSVVAPIAISLGVAVVVFIVFRIYCRTKKEIKEKTREEFPLRPQK